MTKPIRSIEQQTLPPRSGQATPLYGTSSGLNTIWGSDSNANSVDMISVGPITGVDDIIINGSSINDGEYPESILYT